MMLTRRDFLQHTGALIISFQLAPLKTALAAASLPRSLKANPDLDSWLRINADGTITAFMGKVEIGQGILTALSQIIAEELDVDLSRINIIEVDTSRSPEEFMTAGSLSIQQSGSALRLASARARQILVKLAVGQLKVIENNISVMDGQFFVNGRASKLNYWHLLEGSEFKTSSYDNARPKAPSSHTIVGTAVKRLDIQAKAYGESIFIQDLKLEGMLHARLVRPPSYGATLKEIDSLSTENINGIRKVIRDGSFVAVVAVREETAITAADELMRNCRWSRGNDLPAVNDLTGWLKSSVKESKVIAESGKPGSRSTHTAEYSRPYQAHASMSPSIALAVYDNDGLTVWSHSQGIFNLRRAIAKATGINEDRVRCIHKMGCGCYGHNAADDAGYDATLIAMQLPNTPVRLQYSRDDEFRWEPFGSAMAMRVDASLDKNGKINDWQYHVWSCTHSTRPMGATTAGNLLSSNLLEKPIIKPPARNMSQPTGGGDRNSIPLYAFPNMQVTKHFVSEMPIRVSALRGLGAFANVFAIESFMDELATHASKDPLNFRIDHLNDKRAIAVLEKIKMNEAWSGFKKNNGTGKGVAFARYKNSAAYCAVAMFVTVDKQSGIIHLDRAISATDAGQIINPDGVKNQIEGGIIQGASWTLVEQVKFNREGITSLDWSSYPVLKFSEVPEIETLLIDRPNEPSLGAGEASQGPVAAAIANAIADATGIHLRDLPLTKDKLITALS